MLISQKLPFRLSVILLQVSLIGALLFSIVASTSPSAQAAPLYTCTSSHCYGVVEWDVTVNGVDTRIGTRGISGGNGFVDTEMWFVDSTYSYWVEAGITSDTTFNPRDAVELFWADNRPGGGGYHEHFSSPLVSGDYGSNALTRITQAGSGTFNVSISAPVTNLSGQSTNNNITPYATQIGLELYGSSGASVPPVGITNNRSLSGGTWSYRTNDGNQLGNDLPVSAHWSPPPSQSSTGGNWTVCIIGFGC